MPIQGLLVEGKFTATYKYALRVIKEGPLAFAGVSNIALSCSKCTLEMKLTDASICFINAYKKAEHKFGFFNVT